MSISERARVLAVVALSPLSKSRVLDEMGIPRRTYYNWVRREKERESRDGKCNSRRPWNKVGEEEQKLVIGMAQSSPELSPRQLSFKSVDRYGVWIIEKGNKPGSIRNALRAPGGQ